MEFQYRISALWLVLALVLLAGCPNTGSDDTTATADTGKSNASQYPQYKDFSFTSFDGSTGKISDFAGKPMVLNFWAAW